MLGEIWGLGHLESGLLYVSRTMSFKIFSNTFALFLVSKPRSPNRGSAIARS